MSRKLKRKHKPKKPVAKKATTPSETQIAVLNQAIQHHMNGNLNKAEKGYRALVIKNALLPAAYSNLAVILKNAGKYEEAISLYKRALKIKPDYADAYNNLGNLQRKLGQLDEAITSCEQALKIKPDYAEAHHNLGNAQLDLNQLDAAVSSYNRALKIKPDFAEAHNNLGNAQMNLNRLEAAIESYEQALQIKPDFAEAHNNLGVPLKRLGRLSAAIESYGRALQIKPDYAEAHNNLGNAQMDLGQMSLAIESHERALQIKPDYAEAHRHLSFLKKYRQGDPQIELMDSLLSSSSLCDTDRAQLFFALFKAYEDLGQYDKSFDFLIKGNAFRKKELNYNIEYDSRKFAKIKEIFNTSTMQSSVSLTDHNASIRPIFIVGMPRSGTTLVEQIIASHSEVYGAGELEHINNLLFPIISNLLEIDDGQDNSKMTIEDIQSIRNGYLSALTALTVPEKIITDKMPQNFLWIGFMMSAFPQAKIINLNRDPRAICWSIYKNYFARTGNGYAYDMSDLSKFYNLYIDLMTFWHEKFPNKIYDICYEDLTENQEKETRKLLEYCELDWENQCINFHKTERVVKTASAAQVRQKMYKGSSEAWRKYEKHLQPLIKILDAEISESIEQKNKSDSKRLGSKQKIGVKA